MCPDLDVDISDRQAFVIRVGADDIRHGNDRPISETGFGMDIRQIKI